MPATWDGIVSALKRGHPVLLGNLLTSEGHIILVIGYTPDGNLIVNDPYGDKFAPGYGSNNGNGIIYPWKRITARHALEVIGTYPPPHPQPCLPLSRHSHSHCHPHSAEVEISFHFIKHIKKREREGALFF